MGSGVQSKGRKSLSGLKMKSHFSPAMARGSGSLNLESVRQKK